MEQELLSKFISEYIATRRQAKLEAFEKEVVKRLAQGEEARVIAAERSELNARYQPRHWLTDAARRAGQISLVTHAAKFTHGDSRASSLYSETQAHDGYLSTASLSSVRTDAVGNAAALDVAKLLQTDIEGDSLLAALKRGDTRPLAAFAENEAQLTQWVADFSRALTANQPASHKLAKQIYFPVSDSYHLLSPLFATSLTQAVHEKMAALRFDKEAKAIRDARRAGKWHSLPDIRFYQVAEMHFGGTKPQNISALNSARGGRVWLLSSRPPVWRRSDSAPQNMRSMFDLRGEFHRTALPTLKRLVSLLTRSADYNNQSIRAARDGYIDELIDILFMQAASLQQEKWQGWTRDNPLLKPHQQLWLDPWRIKTEETFSAEREKEAWQAQVADDFARWLNYFLGKSLKDAGDAERRYWKTRPLFRRRMREMEAMVQEALK